MKKVLLLTIVTLLLSMSFAFAQDDDCPYDLLETVTISGTVMIIDDGMMQDHFYLDEDGDGTEDFFLNFGPEWYNPDESDAQRPQDGETITITGGLYEDDMMDSPGIFVYEINGLFWRDPCNEEENHGGGHGDGGMMGELEEVTIIGTVMIDTLYLHPMYYLDDDNDDVPDYQLGFGPYWYEPGNGVVRPEAGEEVTIIGGLMEHDHEDGEDNDDHLAMVMVWELNGEFWRDPAEHGGGHHGGGGHNGDHGGGGHGGGHNGGGMWDELVEVTLTGTAMVDSMYFHPHYYLDEDGDNVPDYRLNFGPYWYEPDNGATRPMPGEVITIVGGLYEHTDDEHDWTDMVIVWEINGQFWQDPQEPGWGGQHIHDDDTETMYVYCQTDNEDWTAFPPNSLPGGMMGLHHIYVEFNEQQMWELPNPDENMFAGYHFEILNMGMGGGDMMGNGHMEFDQMISFNMHYTDDQIEQLGLVEDQISLYRWNEASENWNEISDIDLNTGTNTITSASATVFGYYALAADAEPLGVTPDGTDNLVSFAELRQNYPNPFKSASQIQYSLNRSGQVNVTVYDITGRTVQTLVNGHKDSGLYTIRWDGVMRNGQSASNGIYFYVLSVDGNQVETRQMTLLK